MYDGLTRYAFPAGTYFIGDPKLVGKVPCNDGAWLVADVTADGPGVYMNSEFEDDRYTFMVESGALALIPWNAVSMSKAVAKTCGAVIEAPKGGVWHSAFGHFEIEVTDGESIVIDTSDDDDTDDEF